MIPTHIRNLARKLRRNIGIPVHACAPEQSSLRARAEHEAAHAIAALATGGEVVLIHLGTSFGGFSMDLNGKKDGICMTVQEPDNLGVIALAGMAWDRAESIGVSDAALLNQWLQSDPRIGHWPCQKPDLVQIKIYGAMRKAKRILRGHKIAVRALAIAIGKAGGHLDRPAIRRVVAKYSPGLPTTHPDVAKVIQTWNRALRDDSASIVIAAGMGDLLECARRDRAERKSRAARQRSNPTTTRAARRKRS